MARNIFSALLIALSAILLVLSLAAIGVVWFYNERVTQEALARLQQVELELTQAQATLVSSKEELQRALRIVDSAQEALEKLSQTSENGENIFESIETTLDDRVLPELKTTRTRIVAARTSLEGLQSILAGISSFIPGLADSPGQIVTDLIASTRSLDTEIANVEVLATQVSTFVSDTSYLLGGDLTQTRDSLKNFIVAIEDYESKVEGWRKQTLRLIEGAAKWIDQASIGLTVFLAWFALSQFGLLLHGLNMRRGYNPLVSLRRQPVVVEKVSAEEDIDLELGA